VAAADCVTAARNAEATLMFAEAGQAGAAVEQFLGRNAAALHALADRLRAAPPPFVVTCARGSSDNAATYGKYLFETLLGITTASAAPSVSSVYAAVPVAASNALCIAISQSGRSPDLLASVAAQKSAGAHVVALVNDEASPLADLADQVLYLSAGPERSVAATKSFIVSLAGLAALTAAWTQDAALQAAVAALPVQLPRAFLLDWSAATDTLRDARNLFVIGRGFTFCATQEAALKLKETCGLHAECFSAAEVKHGPMTLVRDGFPILGFAGSDAAGDDVRATGALFKTRGAQVHVANDGDQPGSLPVIGVHPAVEPILQIQSFYRMVNQLAVLRGLDPDSPPFLNKVTSTR
jgi:glucosamine--fructose-6-phosphate aminotransferase (isomerizing)